MGDAYRAAGAANGAIYLNPAGIARLTHYSVELMWARLPGGIDAFHGSIVDTKTQPIGVGIGYTWSPGETDRHDGRLALAYPAVPDRLFVGTSLRYLFLDHPSGEDNASAFTLDAGLAAHLGSGFFLGATAHPLLDDQALDETDGRTFGFGLAWEGAASIAADLLLDPAQEGGDRLAYAAGAEYIFGQDVPVRLGWTFAPAANNAHTLSLGFGVVTITGVLDLAYRQRIDEGSEDRTFALSLPLFM